MQYLERDNKTKELKWHIATKYEGFCGLNLEDNSNFYFSVNTDSKYKVNITKINTSYTDTIAISYNTEEIKDKIEKDDIITIYGTTSGETLETGTLGETISLPYINAKYIVLQKN